MTTNGLRGVQPYLHSPDGAAALDWLTRIFGFTELVRYLDENGAVAAGRADSGVTATPPASVQSAPAVCYWTEGCS